MNANECWCQTPCNEGFKQMKNSCLNGIFLHILFSWSHFANQNNELRVAKTLLRAELNCRAGWSYSYWGLHPLFFVVMEHITSVIYIQTCQFSWVEEDFNFGMSFFIFFWTIEPFGLEYILNEMVVVYLPRGDKGTWLSHGDTLQCRSAQPC